MDFEVSKLAPNQVYNLMIGLIVPRPIAWITTVDLQGHLNAAPFSAFNYVGIDPPIVAVGVANRPGPGVIGKDTAQNIRSTREFVVNIVNEELAEAMVVTAIDFPQGVNELEIAKLETAPSKVVAVPRIVKSPASLECREITTLEIGRSRIILGQVVAMTVKDEYIDPKGPYVKADKMHTVGRMNGLGAYVKTRDAFFEIPRLSYQDGEIKKANSR